MGKAWRIVGHPDTEWYETGGVLKSGGQWSLQTGVPRLRTPSEVCLTDYRYLQILRDRGSTTLRTHHMEVQTPLFVKEIFLSGPCHPLPS